MNPAVCPLEDYVQEFCELSHLVDFNDVALKGIFRNGLNYFLNYLMPDNTPHWTREQYIDHALLLSGSSFTVGIVYEGLHNPTAHTTATTPELSMPRLPRQGLFTSCLPG